jgi:hypothetical protein
LDCAVAGELAIAITKAQTIDNQHFIQFIRAANFHAPASKRDRRQNCLLDCGFNWTFA